MNNLEFFRTNVWRQGDIIDQKSAIQTLLKKSSDYKFHDLAIPEMLIIISHDCDILHKKVEDEPYIDLLIGNFDEKDGNLFYAKNPRRLQIEHDKKIIGFIIHNILHIKKEDFEKINPKHSTMVLDKKSVKRIANWVSTRYVRAAFPDEFVNRLKAKQLEKTSKNPLMDKVSLIYVDVPDTELRPEQEYMVTMIIGVQHGSDQEIISQVEDLFYHSFNTPGIKATVEAHDEYDITYEIISTYKRFNWDYRSLPENPNVAAPASHIDVV